MSAATSIQWTDRSWNPIRGCSVVSEGCKNCYAMHVGARFSGPGLAYEGLALNRPARWTGEVRVIEKDIDAPLRWRKPCRVFVNSMSDLFHESLADEQIDRVFARMIAAPRHTYQILTKRADRMRAYIASRLDGSAWSLAFKSSSACQRAKPYAGGVAEGWWPRFSSHVWLGVSVENQARADERIPHLLATPAAVRFLSVEPLLEPTNLHLGRDTLDAYSAAPPIDWVIVGGESGPKARECYVDWIRFVRTQCAEASVPCFIKQLGARPIEPNDNIVDVWPEWHQREMVKNGDYVPEFQGEPVELSLRDKKGGDPSEWPEDLRVREFPRPAYPVADGGHKTMRSQR